MPSQSTIAAIATLAALTAGCGAPGPSNTATAAANVAAPAPPAATSAAAPAANAGAAPANAAAPAAAGPALVIEGEGLRLVDPESGSARPVPFGTPRAALETILAARGRPETGSMAECGEGPTDYATYPDGLQILYQEGAFAGWAIDNRGTAGRGGTALTTMAGLGIGTTRAALEDAYDVTVEESTIGQEFLAGGIGGVLDGTRPGAKVTNLWAGVACIAR